MRKVISLVNRDVPAPCGACDLEGCSGLEVWGFIHSVIHSFTYSTNMYWTALVDQWQACWPPQISVLSSMVVEPLVFCWTVGHSE